MRALSHLHSSICSSVPDPKMWIIKGTLAWCTVWNGVWNQTSPQEDWRGDSGDIQYRSNFLFTCEIWLVCGGPPRLVSSWESIHLLLVYRQLSLEHKFRFGLNEKMERLTMHLHRRTTWSLLSFWGDGGIVPFESFFHAFFGGIEKATINRIFPSFPSWKEERKILFPFRRD